MSMTSSPACDLYLRLSDFGTGHDATTFADREASLRDLAASRGLAVHRVVIENDADDSGKLKSATAWKRQRIRNPDGSWAESATGGPVWRVLRPGFRSILQDLEAGRAQAILAEDLDRVVRDPVDLEDLIDVVQRKRASAASLSGSLTLTAGGTDAERMTARVLAAVAAKSSADTARRVRERKAVVAARGAWSGGRPYGYRSDPDAPKGAKTLLVIEDEAQVIKQAADEVLTSGGRASLKAMARDLRERGMPTVTGAAWSALTLRGALIKPAVAGLAVSGDTLVPGNWPAILDRETWEAVRAILTDPARRTGTGNAPRWLGSGLYRCGKCADGTTVVCRGNAARPGGRAYVCGQHEHLRRRADLADITVETAVCKRLDRDDARDLLVPAGPGVDVAGLKDEQDRLTEIGKRQARMHALGQIGDDELAAGSAARRERLAVIAARLADDVRPDPLAEFRHGRPAREVWDGLSLQRRREVVRALCTVTLMPGRRGHGFDPETVVTDFGDHA